MNIKSLNFDPLPKLIDSINIGVFVLKDKKFIYANNEATRLLHYNKEGLAGKTILEISPDFQPNGMRSSDLSEQYLLKAKQSPVRTEWTYSDKNGQPVSTEIFLSHINDEDTWNDTYMVVWHDITDSRKLEKEHLTCQNHLESFVNYFPAGIYIKDENLINVYANKPALELSGLDLNEWQGKRTRDIFPSKASRILEESDAYVLANDTTVENLIEIESVDGKPLSKRVLKFPLKDSMGNKLVASIALDVTDIIESERKASDALLSVTSVLTNVLELRDPYAAGHEKRVSEIAVKIAEHLSLDDSQIECIRISADIHDIGKIQTPSDILNKTGKLSAAEMSIVKEHVETGYSLVKNVNFPWPVADVIRQHHERADGMGYPNGVKGDDFLIEARIIAVADVLEAMTSHRPYRPGLPVRKAIEELRTGCGTKYDKNSVEACLNLIEDGKLSLSGWQ